MFGMIRVATREFSEKEDRWFVTGKTRLVKVAALQKSLGRIGYRNFLDFQPVKFRNEMIELS